MILVENVKMQTNESCEISQDRGIKGDYFVNLNATPQDPIILFVTDEFGTSKFHRYSAVKNIIDEDPFYDTKILIFFFTWAGLAAFHKSSTI